MMNNIYESPLSSRYASKYMLELFSSDTRYRTWRRLWVSLAKAEMALGLPINQEQIDEMRAHIEDIDYDCVRQREKEVRHDVMAHVYAYGKAAPSAAMSTKAPLFPPTLSAPSANVVPETLRNSRNLQLQIISKRLRFSMVGTGGASWCCSGFCPAITTSRWGAPLSAAGSHCKGSAVSA